MLRGVRAAALAAVIAAFAGALLLTQAGAGPTAAEPGLEEAQQILDCAPGEGVFSYQAAWGEGAGFETPSAALAGILAATDFGVSRTDFIGREVAVGGDVASEFTVRLDGKATVVTWATRVDKGWLVDGVYGCTATAD